MGFLKKIGVKKLFDKASHGAQQLFQKGEVGGIRLFGKGSEGSKILGQVKNGLQKAGDVAGQVGKQISEFAGNPVVQGILGSNPVGRAVLTGAGGLGAGLGGASNVAHTASGLANQANYSGSASNVAKNILERAKATGDATNAISFV